MRLFQSVTKWGYRLTHFIESELRKAGFKEVAYSPGE